MASTKNKKADVMISYSEIDLEFVKYLAGSLEKEDLSTWYIDPSMAKAKAINIKAQAVVDCKALILVLSEESVKDKLMQDELALAYISNKPIFPIGLKYFRKIAAHMTGGMKLMLAKINWTFFVKKDKFEETLVELVQCIRNEFKAIAEANTSEEGDDLEAYDTTMNIHQVEGSEETNMEADDEERPQQQQASSTNVKVEVKSGFWERHFDKKNEVPWTEFRDKFLLDYGERITRQFDDDKQKWFVQVLYKDVFDLKKVITKTMYSKFEGKNTRANPDHFYERLKDYAIGSLAMREVFNMDSSVRLTAIQNLGAFQTQAVIAQLFELVQDSDPNIRAVAVLALAKTGKRTTKIEDRLIKMLNDEDRLVRESSCLSLAHMKCHRAVPNITDLWRNDAIKHVREAAELALTRIGGTQSQEAIKITQVLTSEIQNLKSA